jgi:hypothetical protein
MALDQKREGTPMSAIPAETEFVRRLTRAEAIRNVCANRSGRGRPWQDLPERAREDYRAEAAAALRAVGVIQ